MYDAAYVITLLLYSVIINISYLIPSGRLCPAQDEASKVPFSRGSKTCFTILGVTIRPLK